MTIFHQQTPLDARFRTSTHIMKSSLQAACAPPCSTVEDLALDISPAGLFIAATSVISSGLQQIFVRTMQQKHKLSAHELLSNTAPAQVRSSVCGVCARALCKAGVDRWVGQTDR